MNSRIKQKSTETLLSRLTYIGAEIQTYVHLK